MRQQKTALRELQKDTSITILPADKGNATVAMDRDFYDQKICTLLEDDMYIVHLVFHMPFIQYLLYYSRPPVY